MQNVIITELETNLSFESKIDKTPEVTQNYSTVYVDEKEIKYSDVRQLNGFIKVELIEPRNSVCKFLEKWNASKKRINTMLETGDCLYLLKNCYIREFDADKNEFILFYNTYKKS